MHLKIRLASILDLYCLAYTSRDIGDVSNERSVDSERTLVVRGVVVEWDIHDQRGVLKDLFPGLCSIRERQLIDSPIDARVRRKGFDRPERQRLIVALKTPRCLSTPIDHAIEIDRLSAIDTVKDKCHMIPIQRCQCCVTSQIIVEEAQVQSAVSNRQLKTGVVRGAFALPDDSVLQSARVGREIDPRLERPRLVVQLQLWTRADEVLTPCTLQQKGRSIAGDGC